MKSILFGIKKGTGSSSSTPFPLDSAMLEKNKTKLLIIQSSWFRNVESMPIKI